MPVDTSRTVEIENSPVKLVGLVAIGIVMTALGGVLAVGWIPDRPDAFARFIGYCGLVFFAACTLVALGRLLAARGPVVTISPLGIRDTRISADVIPWSAVTRISTWEFKRQKAMVLAVAPATEAKLTLTRMARWTRDANRALGADGLCITASGLKIDYDKLLATATAYAQAGGGAAAGRTRAA